MPLFIRFFNISVFVKTLMLILVLNANADENFDTWLTSYKKLALKKGISQETINIAFKNVKFLDQVIKYDRKQPEFFEVTKTYVEKRANILRVITAVKLFNKNIDKLHNLE